MVTPLSDTIFNIAKTGVLTHILSMSAVTQESNIGPKRIVRVGSYVQPSDYDVTGLNDLIALGGREKAEEKQLDFLNKKTKGEVKIYSSGELSLLKSKIVAIVGSRDSSEDGRRRAARLARELSEAGVTVSSGLAAGIDTAALEMTVRTKGRVVAVIGTPLDKAYPASNKRLQEKIYSEHLLLTPFMHGQRVFPSNFPQRNRVMALLSDATVIIEASDTSGTLHQAAECIRQNRFLFIAKSVVEDSKLSWPEKFLGQPRVRVLESTADLIAAI